MNLLPVAINEIISFPKRYWTFRESFDVGSIGPGVIYTLWKMEFHTDHSHNQHRRQSVLYPFEANVDEVEQG